MQFRVPAVYIGAGTRNRNTELPPKLLMASNPKVEAPFV